jgi:hypothetical protein
MTEANKSTAYGPGPLPGRSQDLPAYLAVELERIASALRALANGHIDMSYRPPDKPRDGDIRLADGTEWDPGAGAGVYAWYGGAWRKLG